ncbi:hypothetical protein OG730_37845 [Streptomyces sp. NBC_01298]|uniref:hypothetical protein n=1 Tax=Streptomyces sp. NBC_01298 TaxID=2903817 RepID=UPI002E0DAF32|nr:hypothetical protein OG730_37845 [Streptomyces sp. NBC_01298]
MPPFNMTESGVLVIRPRADLDIAGRGLAVHPTRPLAAAALTAASVPVAPAA